MSNWTPMTTPPTADMLYLVYAPSADPDRPLIHVAWWDIEGGHWSLLPSAWLSAITHWMPLPAPPLNQVGDVKGKESAMPSIEQVEQYIECAELDAGPACQVQWFQRCSQILRDAVKAGDNP